MKDNVITPFNVREQKMSTLFYSVLDDIKKTERLKIEINMSTWSSVSGRVCSVCLGGSAVLGFVPDMEILKAKRSVVGEVSDVIVRYYTSIDGVEFGGNEAEVLSKMALMFNSFRQGNIWYAISKYNEYCVYRNRISYKKMGKIYSEYNLSVYTYMGKMDKDEMKKIKKDIKAFAQILEKYNA